MYSMIALVLPLLDAKVGSSSCQDYNSPFLRILPMFSSASSGLLHPHPLHLEISVFASHSMSRFPQAGQIGSFPSFPIKPVFSMISHHTDRNAACTNRDKARRQAAAFLVEIMLEEEARYDAPRSEP